MRRRTPTSGRPTAAIVGAALDTHPGDIPGALYEGFALFFTDIALDPMIASLLAGDANPDLLRLITTDAGPLITTASEILHQALADSTWLNMSTTPSASRAR